MDLAAERFYSNFLIMREQYWESLDEATRQAAIERGQSLLAEYGDDVAKPRMAKILRKERSVTGSRVGFVGNLEIIPFTGPNAGNGMSIRADEYYAPKYWQADKYFEWQDQVWDAPGARKGRVEVGGVEQAGKASPPDSEDEPRPLRHRCSAMRVPGKPNAVAVIDEAMMHVQSAERTTDEGVGEHARKALVAREIHLGWAAASRGCGACPGLRQGRGWHRWQGPERDEHAHLPQCASRPQIP